MTHENKLREALRKIMQHHTRNCTAMLPSEVHKICVEALADVNETPKNEHDRGDVLKRAPLVRLTDEELKRMLHEIRLHDDWDSRGDCDANWELFANAIRDAMIAKNGGGK